MNVRKRYARTPKRPKDRAESKEPEQSLWPDYKPRAPTEAKEQVKLANYCRARGLVIHHSPNEGKRSYAFGQGLRSAGMSRGFPDLLILNPCEYIGGRWVGVAIELKRTTGGVVSPEQERWIAMLRTFRWLAFIAKGADAAIDILQACKFEPTPRPEVAI